MMGYSKPGARRHVIKAWNVPISHLILSKARINNPSWVETLCLTKLTYQDIVLITKLKQLFSKEELR